VNGIATKSDSIVAGFQSPEAVIHLFKVLATARKTTIESAGGATSA
jgi:hypothetical protein